MIAGVDEVGRGPLAGPVIAAAVILNHPISGLMDSKCLSPQKRVTLATLIQDRAEAYALGRAEVHEIDVLNIHHATLLAMQRAIQALTLVPSNILVDGLYCPNTALPCQAIVKGDSLIYQISAASILAKVARDAEMVQMDAQYPDYGFARHKGYPTLEHRHALQRLGPCAIHRLSFKPLRPYLSKL